MPQFGGASEKCNVCSKTVYLAEKIVVEDKEDKKTFHKTCLKCTHCKVTLNLGNYASMNGVMYCKPHFKQLFATKGNYDEGFGKEKLTSKWEPQAAPAPASNSFVPVTNTSETSASTSSSDGGKKETPSSIAARFQKSSTASEKCDTCGKTVYATERIVIEEKDGKKVFHKGCLKCTHCKVVLSLGNYASMNGITYCKPHFKQLFATKGNYDEGFGKEKATSKWDPQVNTAPTTFVPVTSDEPVKSEKKADPTVTSKFGNASEKCTSCGKTVYLTEKIVVEDKDDKQVFHKSCLRCTHCQIVLTLGNYASMKGVMYCKPHFKQLFAAKGNYEEGFGKEKVTAKWTKEGESEEEPRSEESPAQTRHHEEEPRHEETRHHHEEEPEPKHEEEPPRHHEEEHRHHEEEPKHEESHHHEEESHHHHEEEHHHHHDEEHEHSHDHNDEHHHHDGEHEHHHHEEEHHHHHEEEERREEEVAEEEKRDDE